MTIFARLAARLIRRGFLIVLVLVPGLSAIVVVQYRYTFVDPTDAISLQALAQNPAIRVLFGVPLALDNAGGFTVWRTGAFAAVTLASWALLTATRITRGEEQAGRWALLLTGRLRLSSLAAQHLVVLLGAQLLVGGALALAFIVAGAGTRGALIYGLGIALVGMLFAAVGTLCAQLIDERRLASGIAVAVLGLTLLLRMVADGTERLAGLAWLTPFGLLAEAEPYAANRLGPLAALAAMVSAVAGLAVLAAACRDLGSGVMTGSETRPGRFLLLRSVPGFAIRRVLPPTVGWATGLCVYFLIIGMLARSLTEFLIANPRFAELAAQAGFGGLASVQGYAAALFTLLAIPLGVFAASLLSHDAADEADGRLAAVFSRPLPRSRWALVQVAVIVVAVVGLAIAAGVATATGTAIAGEDLQLAEALAGALNVVPVAVLCLGAAEVAIGWLPQAVLALGAVPVVGGFLLIVLVEAFDWPNWLARLSPFAHLASVPATAPDWAGAAGMIGLSMLLAGVGIAGFARRDLRR
jgi:polyether ionophore transport system permease protein